MEKIKKLLILLSFIITFSITHVYADGLTLFTTEVAAKKHCPNDTVVWLNLPTGIWHYKGARWYGRTKHGSYVCINEARAANDRASMNGS